MGGRENPSIVNDGTTALAATDVQAYLPWIATMCSIDTTNNFVSGGSCVTSAEKAWLNFHVFSDFLESVGCVTAIISFCCTCS